MPSSLACAEQSRGARRKPPVLILLRETKLVRLWCAKKPPWLEGLVRITDSVAVPILASRSSTA